MSEIDFYTNCLFLLFVCGSAPLAVAAVVGIFVATLQAVTQIQEQSVGFLARLLVLSGVFLLLGSQGWNLAVGLIKESFTQMVRKGVGI